MKKYLITLLTTGILLGATSAQASVILVGYENLDGTDDTSRSTIATNMSTSGTSSNLLIDITGDIYAANDSRGYRVNGIGNSSFSDTQNFFGFVAEAGSGYVFDLSDDFTTGDGVLDWSYAQIKSDRISGDAYNIEAVIWEGSDRTGTELFRETFFVSDSTADATMRFGGISTIAGVSTNISQIYVQFNYRSTNGVIAFDNFRLVGDLVAVPEPSTYALFAGFLALGGVMLRRRLRR